MKTILIYSAKGGVGKTTCAAAISKFVAAHGCKVFVLDLDINTPSMDVMFENPHPDDNIWVASTGFLFDSLIFMDKSMITEYINKSLKDVYKVNPDYLIIDMPPSVSQVHIEVINRFRIGYLLFITHPTRLSISDVSRTINFFRERVNIGDKCAIIENMSLPNINNEYDIPCIAKIPIQDNLDGSNIHEVCIKQMNDIYNEIRKSVDVNKVAEIGNNMLYDESFDIDIKFNQRRGTKYVITATYDNGEVKEIYTNVIKFISVRTWETIKDFIISNNIRYDALIHYNTTEKISNVVNAFKNKDAAYFLVVRAPLTEIRLIPSEIGSCTFNKTSDSYYGIPTVQYQTSKGAVTLFPHEVTPLSFDDVQKIINEEKYIILTDGRYLPTKESLFNLMCMFGDMCGASEDILKIYDEWIKSNKNDKK